jgi:hypothetical protein
VSNQQPTESTTSKKKLQSGSCKTGTKTLTPHRRLKLQLPTRSCRQLQMQDHHGPTDFWSLSNPSSSPQDNVRIKKNQPRNDVWIKNCRNDIRTQRIHLGIKGVGKLQLTLVVLGVLVAAFPETEKQQETWESSSAHILESRNMCKHPLS